jgi:LemA protein
MGISAAILTFLFLVVIVFISIAISTYNSLVALKKQVDRAWANIDVILKQRFDEIPQLITWIEQYVQYEKGIIAQVSEARRHYSSAKTTNQKVAAAQKISLALKGVVAIGEAYPELRSNQNFVQLQSRVSQLENDIADRREVFNEAATNYNTRIEQFPDLIFARMLNYVGTDLLRATDAEKTTPNLKMNLGN